MSELIKAIDVVDQIKKYKELFDMGIISADEFKQKKHELIGIENDDITGNKDFSNDSTNGSKSNVVNHEIPATAININPNNIEPTIIRIELFLENHEWEKAYAYSNAALDYFPTDYRLYLYLLCTELRVPKADDLASANETFSESVNYKMLKRFASDELKEKIESDLKTVEQRIKDIAEAEELKKEEEKKSSTYREALRLIKNKSASDHSKAIDLLEELGDWEDSLAIVEQCKTDLEAIKKKEEIEAIRISASNGSDEGIISNIKRLKELFDEGIINEDEFNDIKKSLLFPGNNEASKQEVNETVLQKGEPETESTNGRTENRANGGITVLYENTVLLENFDGEKEWLVLDKKGDYWLLLSKYCQRPGVVSNESNYTWETSEVRKYLNGEFLEKFTEKQRECIAPVNITADNGTQITDLVYLLSVDEYNNYSSIIEPKANAWRDQGVKLEWALRTGSGNNIYVVNKYGYAVTSRIKTIYLGVMTCGMRPAIWINITKLG